MSTGTITEFKYLQIPLKDIISATNNFASNKCIGRGGFGKVYYGELLLSKKLTMVAIKRLNSEFGQGASEFWKEIMMLSRYKHENLVSLLGFCDEKGESILVYEYLPKKSLDLHLSNTNLSWKQRLRICIGAACGLQYLHDHNGTQQRVLHRDIKSANILLDQNWEAKISDFGLSKIGPANQQFTFLVSNVVGTMGYCDPLYHETGYLTKESDVYSFGVVLFEVLCGRPGVQDYEDSRRFLANLAQRSYEEKKLDTIIDRSLKVQISSMCLQRFSKIAYQCLQRDRAKRPSMAKIRDELEIAFQMQREHDAGLPSIMFEMVKLLERYLEHHADNSKEDVYWRSKQNRWNSIKLAVENECIMNMLNPLGVSKTTKKLLWILHHGIFFDKDRRGFSINDNGAGCELLFPKTFLDPTSSEYEWEDINDFRRGSLKAARARFPYKEKLEIHCRISASVLSCGAMYAASLVFSFENEDPIKDAELKQWLTIKWICQEMEVSSTHCTEVTTQRWMKIRLWHFVNTRMNPNFDIAIHKISYVQQDEQDPPATHILIYGIEFQPIKMIDQAVEGGHDNEILEVKDDDVNYEKNMPSDYQGIIRRSVTHLEYRTQRDLYFLLCAGILINNNGPKWFSLCKSTGQKCHMLPALKILDHDKNSQNVDVLSLSESRFKEAIQLKGATTCHFTCNIESNMVSRGNIYACYLVFKFAEAPIGLDAKCLVKVHCTLDVSDKGTIFAHLNYREPINIPTIMPKDDNGVHDMSNVPIFDDQYDTLLKEYMDESIHQWMEQRNDGWMEIILCTSLYRLEVHQHMLITLTSKESDLLDIIVQGIEFRPIRKVD